MYLQLDSALNHLPPIAIPVRLTHPANKLVVALSESRPSWGLIRRVVVLATQHTKLERRKRRQPQPEPAVQSLELALDLCPREQVVLRLLDNGPNEPQLLRDAACLCNLVGSPLGCAPVQRPALCLDDVVEGPDRLLHGRQAVGAVGVDDVDVLEVKTLERGAEALDDVFARQAVVVD